MIHSSSSLLISCDFQILPLPLPSGCHGWFMAGLSSIQSTIMMPFDQHVFQVEWFNHQPSDHCWFIHIHTDIYYIALHYITLHTLHYIHYITYITYIPYIHTMHTCHAYIPFIHSFIHTYIHTYDIHTYILTYLLTYLHTYIHTYVRTYIHTYIQTYIHTYNILYIYTYMCARVKSCYYYMFIPTFRVSLWSN